MTEIRLRELLSGLDTGDIILSWLSDEINKDMDSFAEWCAENGWNVSIKKHRWVNDNGGGINTAQIREMWEDWKAQQRGEATE